MSAPSPHFPPAAGPAVYALVRIPKSGTTSLVSMVTAALPSARAYYMPKLLRSDEGPSRLEKLRETRSRWRRLWRLFGTLSEETAWRRLAARLREGDIVSGHFAYGAPQLPGFGIRYVTLLRDPLKRLISEYNYARLGYSKRGAVQRLTNRGRLAEAAGRSFGGYLAFLEEHRSLYEDIALRYVTGGRGCDDPLAHLESHFFHYGALERLELFAEQLGAKLCAKVELRRERVTPASAEVALSVAERARFERLFERDIAMHQSVLAHLDGQARGR